VEIEFDIGSDGEVAELMNEYRVCSGSDCYGFERQWENELSIDINWITYTWNGIGVADIFREQPITYFPGEDGRTLALVLRNGINYNRSGNTWFASAYSSWFDRSGFIIPTEDFRDTAVRDLQHP